MGHYTLTHNGDNGYPDFNSFREFWTRSHAGRYLAEYEAGYAAAQDDPESALHDLDAVSHSFRDTGWDARLDGYRDAQRPAGTTKLDP